MRPQGVKSYRGLVVDLLGSECKHCKSKENLEIDHIISFERGGENTISNVQLLCKSCHFIKTLNERGLKRGQVRVVNPLFIRKKWEAQVIQLIQEKKSLRAIEIISFLGIPRFSFKKVSQKLRKDGKLTCSGLGRNTSWSQSN